MFHMQPTY